MDLQYSNNAQEYQFHLHLCLPVCLEFILAFLQRAVVSQLPLLGFPDFVVAPVDPHL